MRWDLGAFAADPKVDSYFYFWEGFAGFSGGFQEDIRKVFGPVAHKVDSYFGAMSILRKSCSRRGEIAILQGRSFQKTIQNRGKTHSKNASEKNAEKMDFDLPGTLFSVATWRQVRPGTAFAAPRQEMGTGMAGAASASSEASDGNLV